MFNFTNRLRLPGLHRDPDPAKEPAKKYGAAEATVRLLLVTLDDDLYFSVRTAAFHGGWELRKASSVEQGQQLLDESGASLVIYDWNPHNGDWQTAVDQFVARGDHPCVLLASKVIDDYLLAELVRHGGFGAISRAATEEQLVRSIRFAHFALQHSNPSRADGSSGITRGGRPFPA